MGGGIVAITGRPNVGKSTLFNRLIKKRKAIVDDISGVTRDRIYDIAEWNGHEFTVVDTGGYVENSRDVFEKEIKKQVEIAVSESSLVLFMVDVSVGITDLDENFAKFLRKSGKKVLLVANKTDNFEAINESYSFYKLGFKDIYPISSLTGSGTGELLDHIVNELKSVKSDFLLPDIPRFAVVGKPNVGKSTFVNKLLDEERNIVSDIPGTTRDSVHSIYNKYGYHFILIDTAGLRKKSSVHENIEFYSVMRAVKSIDECDVCLVITDAVEGIGSQDVNIINLAERKNKGVVVLVNKWDLTEKSHKQADKLINEVKNKLAPFNDIPILMISALNKVRLMKAVEAAFHVYQNKNKKIQTSELNRYFLPIIEEYHPPAVKGKIINIKYVTQIPAPFPLFAFFANHPQYIKENYKRFLENKLREKYDFTGVPVRIVFRKK